MSAITKWLDGDGTGDGVARVLSPALVLALLAAALLLPFLGSFGLWDPQEVRVAEAAREMAQAHTFVVPAQAPAPHAPLMDGVISIGYRLLGPSEIAGRLPVALLSMGALLAAWLLASGLSRRRAALLGGLVLLTMPAFFLGARQLTSHAGAMLAGALAVCGLSRAAWPAPRAGMLRSPVAALCVGAFGLGLGYLASGILLGAAVPLAATAIALAVAGPEREDATSEVASDQAPSPKRALALAAIYGVLGFIACAAAALAWSRGQPGHGHVGYSALLGGTPRAQSHAVELATLLRHLGFGAFPAIALLPLAVARAFAPAAPAPLELRTNEDDSRARFGRLLLVAWLVLGYFAHTLLEAGVNEPSHIALYVPIALLAGEWLDWLWRSSELPLLLGIVALVGAALVGHDVLMQPESFISAHLVDPVKWPVPAVADHVLLGIHLPSPLQIAPELELVIGLVFGSLLAVGCALHGRRTPTSTATSNAVLDDGDRAVSVASGGRDLALLSLLGTLLAGAALTTWFVVPEVSKHLSYKGLFNKYKSMVGTGDSEIGKYHVPGQLAEYGKTIDLATLPQVFDFLAKPRRVFVIAGADDLPAIDQYARSKGGNGKPLDYYVVDDSNAKFLMISNQLGKEKDLNPLRRLVIPEGEGLLHKPEHAAAIDFDGKVELIGYDLPAELERGQEFTIRMYYKVKQPIASPYKVFIHFDGPGSRFNGDHVPLEGRFPTNYWVPGFYVIDEHKVTPERATAPPGTYQLFTGFWLGDSRLKVTQGPQDGEQRAKLGAVRVK